MKKRFTRPDGTVEEIEGSPEEIAAYERQLNGGTVQEQAREQRRLLKEERSASKRIADAFEELVKERRDRLPSPHVCPHVERWYPYMVYPHLEWWLKPAPPYEITWTGDVIRHPDSFTLASTETVVGS